MPFRITLAAVVGLAGLTAARSGEKQADDATAIRGTWSVVSAAKGGKDLPPEVTQAMRVTITADTITIADGKRREEARRYELDPKAKPRAIDILEKVSTAKGSGDAKGQTVPLAGVYELAGDRLTLTVNTNEKAGKRPERAGEKGPDFLTFVLQRAKQ